MTPHAFKKFEYLRELEFIFKKTLAPELRAYRTDVLMKKNEDRKSRDTVPLRFCLVKKKCQRGEK
jgi:hypothetical protein